VTRHLSPRQVAELTDLDRAELDKFEQYLTRVAAGESMLNGQERGA